MALIRIIEGVGIGSVAEIVGGALTLGREADNGLVVGDPKSSRNHCEVVREGDTWHLHDLGSSNGTWTDAGRVESLELNEGSVFRIGRTYLRFELGEDSEQTQVEQTDPAWLDPNQLEGLKNGTDLFHRPLGGTTTQLARHNTYLVLLHQLIERSRAARSRDELFGLLDEAAAEVLEGDRCAVFLPTDEAWELWPPHERRLRARYGAVPFARTLLRAVRRHKEPLLCTVLGDLNPSQSMLQAGVRSAMSAPLRIGDELHATLYVDRLKGVTPFTRTDLEFLAAVANQLAVCLTNLANVARMSAEISRLTITPAIKPLRLIGQTLTETEALAIRVAASAEPCLIMGESGTGKDLLARIIHQRSPRATRPLQILACSGIDPDKLDATLLGTAADARPGLLELADQATLLIDEITDLPPESQARLVRFLDTGEMVRIGDHTIRRADVRVVATSSRDLRQVSNDGRLRSDLLSRLSALSFFLPPVVERVGDLDGLIEYFLNDCAHRLDQSPKRLTPEARTVLQRAAWPGNVGQLKQALDRACIASADHLIHAADLPNSLQPAMLTAGTGGVAGSWPIGSLSAIERLHIIKVLDHCGGNKKAAAEVLEIDRSTLYAKLRQYGLA